MRRKLTRHTASVAVVVTTFAACADGDTRRLLGSPSAQAGRGWVASRAAAALDADGNFRIPVHVPLPGVEIGPEQAVALAEAYVNTFGRWLVAGWERDRNAPIDYARLESCGPAAYARSPYDAGASGPGAALPPALRQALAPQYLVELCVGGVPTVSIAVAATATTPRVVGRRISGANGGDFFSVGIPSRMPRSVVPAANAAHLAAERTGRRVVDVPELVLPAFPGPPQLARWRITLDATARVRGRQSGAVRGTQVVYAGYGATWRTVDLQAANPNVPAAVLSIPSAAAAGAGQSRASAAEGRVTLNVPMAAGFPPVIESVEVTP